MVYAISISVYHKNFATCRQTYHYIRSIFVRMTELPHVFQAKCSHRKLPHVQMQSLSFGSPPWHMGVSKNRSTPKNGWFVMENLIKMDDLGVPLFSETSICIHLKWHEPVLIGCSLKYGTGEIIDMLKGKHYKYGNKKNTSTCIAWHRQEKVTEHHNPSQSLELLKMLGKKETKHILPNGGLM